MTGAATDAVSYAEAGRRLGVSTYRVRKLIADRHLRTVMRFGRPMVTVSSLRAHVPPSTT